MAVRPNSEEHSTRRALAEAVLQLTPRRPARPLIGRHCCRLALNEAHQPARDSQPRRRVHEAEKFFGRMSAPRSVPPRSATRRKRRGAKITAVKRMAIRVTGPARWRRPLGRPWISAVIGRVIVRCGNSRGWRSGCLIPIGRCNLLVDQSRDDRMKGSKIRVPVCGKRFVGTGLF